MNIGDFKNIKRHARHGVVYPQIKKKDGTTWIMKQNGESFSVPTDELDNIDKEFLLAKYVNKKLNIIDASSLSSISLEKITLDLLIKEKDVKFALEVSDVIGIQDKFIDMSL